MKATVDVCPTLLAAGNQTGGDRPPGTDVDTCESLIVLPLTGGNSNAIDVATTVSAKGGIGRMDFESETFVRHSLRAEGFDASEDGTGRGVPLVPVAIPIPMYTLQGEKQHAVAFSCKNSGADAGEVAPTMRSMAHDGSHANAGGQLAVAFHARQDTNVSGDVTHPLDRDGTSNAIAFNLRGREDGSQPEVSDIASLRSASGGSSRSYAATKYAVRRLTVIECCRLQGVPEGYTHIKARPRKIAADEGAYLAQRGLNVWQDGEQWMTDVVADGPQYKALGNGWAVPVVRWIGERLQMADEAFRKRLEDNVY